MKTEIEVAERVAYIDRRIDQLRELLLRDWGVSVVALSFVANTLARIERFEAEREALAWLMF
jgi:hypothetical protein